jgi:hypothetical protein
MSSSTTVIQMVPICLSQVIHINVCLGPFVKGSVEVDAVLVALNPFPMHGNRKLEDFSVDIGDKVIIRALRVQ